MMVCPVCSTEPERNPSYGRLVCRCLRLQVGSLDAWFIESKRVPGGWAGWAVSVEADGVKLWEVYPDGYGDGSSSRQLHEEPQDFLNRMVRQAVAEEVLES